MDGEVWTLIILLLLILLRIRTAEPQVGDAVNLLDADQLPVLGPSSARELLTPEVLLLQVPSAGVWIECCRTIS